MDSRLFQSVLAVCALWLVAAGVSAANIPVTNTNDSGAGSLRQAILDANGSPGSTITFAIGSGVKTIRPLSDLPAIVSGMIDGTTQPGYSGTPIIVIDGGLLPALGNCLSAGGTSIVKALVVGNCSYHGISLSESAKLLGSFVGTDPTGQLARGNGVGVNVYGAPTVGGTGPGEGNLISGNNYGIYAFLAQSLIIGNRIGTNLNGMAAIPNLDDGIFLDHATGIVIGGTAPGAGNLISGNNQYGIQLFYTNDAVVRGNTIGPDALGGGSFSNQRAGVDIYQSSRAAVEGNTIAYHTAAGIGVEPTSARNALSRNSLFSNAFGIDLDFQLNTANPRLTPNDPCDSDTGPNLLQNFPVLSLARIGGGHVSVAGSLNSEPDSAYTLEFFASPTCNASGYGEGKTYLGSLSVMTDASCNASFSGDFVADVLLGASGQVITATATDVFGDTSEFSQCVPLVPAAASFYTVTPCRVADTRDPPGPSGGPGLAANTIRTFPVANVCGIPSSATAVAINVAVFQPTDGGDLRVYPTGTTAPLASAINFRPSIVRSNNAIVPLGGGGQISVQCDMPSGSTHFFFDVFGYFQ